MTRQILRNFVLGGFGYIMGCELSIGASLCTHKGEDMSLQQKIIIVSIWVVAIIASYISFVIYEYKRNWIYKYKKEKERRQKLEDE